MALLSATVSIINLTVEDDVMHIDAQVTEENVATPHNLTGILVVAVA